MERGCYNCPFYYVSGFSDSPTCNKNTDNDGECWADDNEYVSIGDNRYALNRGGDCE